MGQSDRKGKSRAADNGNPNGNAGAESQDFLALDIDGDRGESGQIQGGGGYQQMQLVEQQVCPWFSLPSSLLPPSISFQLLAPSP